MDLKNGFHHSILPTSIFIFICICCTKEIFAQLPVIKSSVDKSDILIGQQINFHLQVTIPDNTYRLNWFEVPDSFATFITISKDKIDTTLANGNLDFSQNILLTNFDSGRQVIPPLQLSVSNLSNDSSFNLFTDSMIVNVSYSPTDSIMPFHDIKTIMEVKTQWPWWIWALLVLAVILLGIWIWFLIRFFKKKKENFLFESKLSPYEEAMQSLNQMEKEDLLAKNKVKEYHTRLTDIFKRYLSRKSNSYLLHLTTDEILVQVNDLGLSKEKLTDFANALRMSNVVKFAQFIPPTYENEKCFSTTKEMIQDIDQIANKKPADGL